MEHETSLRHHPSSAVAGLVDSVPVVDSAVAGLEAVADSAGAEDLVGAVDSMAVVVAG